MDCCEFNYTLMALMNGLQLHAPPVPNKVIKDLSPTALLAMIKMNQYAVVEKTQSFYIEFDPFGHEVLVAVYILYFS